MLQRRGKIYTSRVVVPVDLQPLLHRVEITRSLRTSERRKALRRLSLWETHVGLLMTTIRLQGTGMMRKNRRDADQLVAELQVRELHDALERWTIDRVPVVY